MAVNVSEGEVTRRPVPSTWTIVGVTFDLNPGRPCSVVVDLEGADINSKSTSDFCSKKIVLSDADKTTIVDILEKSLNG